MFVELKKANKPDSYIPRSRGVNSFIKKCLLCCDGDKKGSGSTLICPKCHHTYNTRSVLLESCKEKIYSAFKGDPSITYYNPPNAKLTLDQEEADNIERGRVYKYMRSLYLHHQVNAISD